MTDKQIMELIKRFNKEAQAATSKRYGFGKVEYAINEPAGSGMKRTGRSIKTERKKTNIRLLSMTDDELTELRTIIKIERHKPWNEDRIKAKQAPAIKDVQAWKRRFGITTLNHDEAIKDIRSKAPSVIVASLKNYLLDIHKDNPFIRNSYMIWMHQNNLW